MPQKTKRKPVVTTKKKKVRPSKKNGSSLSEGLPPSAPDDPRQVTVEEVIEKKEQTERLRIAKAASEEMKALANGKEIESQESQDKNFAEAVVATVKEELEAAKTVLQDVELQLTESREANASLRRKCEKLQDVYDACKSFRGCALETEEDGKIVRCGMCPGCKLEAAVKKYREEA